MSDKPARILIVEDEMILAKRLIYVRNMCNLTKDV